MALRTHNLPCERLKIDFGDVDEEMFHDVQRKFEPIFYILGILDVLTTTLVFSMMRCFKVSKVH
jgi:hypothetical protein